MTSRLHHGAVVALALLWPASGASAGTPRAADLAFFESKIRPVLVEHCYRCHSAEAKKARGGLELDTAAGLLKGGDNGPAVVPGDPKKGLLLRAIRHEGALAMPPKGKKLPDAVARDFEAWVRIGAPDPRTGKAAVKGIDLTKAREFWAFRRPVRHAPPAVKDAAWLSNEIDAFVLAGLEKRGLRPGRPAGKRELIRRATFGLTGLPPTPEEVEAFEKDNSPGAFARVVDRLLASPHHGERWGRHWLDVSRYADDKALAFPTPWPHAWRYRDWVVRAINEDMPYDRFLRLQLAADLMPGEGGDSLIALGFQGLGAEYHKGSVPAQVKADEVDDRIDTLTRGLLGLTAACARCHDHKFDPISQRDYYSLAAAYNGASWSVVTISPPEVVARHKAWEKAGREMEARIARWSEECKSAIVRPQLQVAARYLVAAWRLRAMGKTGGTDMDELARREKLLPRFLSHCVAWLGAMKGKPLPGALGEWLKAARTGPEALEKATADLQGAVSAALKAARPTPQEQALLRALTQGKAAPFSVAPAELPGLLGAEERKQLESMQAELGRHKAAPPPKPDLAHGVSGGGGPMRVAVRGNVERLGEAAPPGFLRVLESKPGLARKQFTRLDLAEAVCSPDNPLTARVIVNRVWMHHFGRGLVATASNFGQLGERPTHPELLDNLAVRFVENGWSLKWLHRQILLSSAYRLSSAHDAKNAGIDPENAYLWRHTPRRLDVEAWRDAILAVSGRLGRKFGGPPGGLDDERHVRRTLYGKVSRIEPDRMLVAFDFPDANVSSERRAVTVVPQQQLFALNSEFMIASARAFARRLRGAAAKDEQRVALAHRLAYGRAPTAAEARLAMEFLREPIGHEDKLTAWEQYAQAILAANEFVWAD